MAIARRSVDRHAGIHEPLARLVNIVDPVGEVAEIPPAVIRLGSAAIFRGPIICQLDLGYICLPKASEENEGKTALLYINPADFLESNKVEKGDGGVGIRYADHAVKKMGHARILSCREHLRHYLNQKRDVVFAGQSVVATLDQGHSHIIALQRGGEP